MSYIRLAAPVPELSPTRNPCLPSPCGPNSECRDISGNPSCSCLANYIGVPPNCRPECSISSDCPSNLACIREKCLDPCPGSCGIGAQCSVINHIPICTCVEGFTGDPFTRCIPNPPTRKDKIIPQIQQYIYLIYSVSSRNKSLQSFTVWSKYFMRERHL